MIVMCRRTTRFGNEYEVYRYRFSERTTERGVESSCKMLLVLPHFGRVSHMRGYFTPTMIAILVASECTVNAHGKR